MIDYYYDESLASSKEGSGMVGKGEHGKIKCIQVDVRPAADTPEAVIARTVRMPWAVRKGDTSFRAMEFMPSEDMKKQRGESERTWETIISNEKVPVVVSEEERIKAKENLKEISNKCKSLEEALSNCKTDTTCAKASLALTMCMARIGCKVQHEAFRKVLEKGEDEGVDKALEIVVECVAGIEGKANGGGGR